jgi:4-hydroxy-tetrahydrodipicolinate synthase
MNNGKCNWKGNFVAVVTPFRETGEIDQAAFTENIRLLVSEGAEGIIVSGCTGEAWALSAEERVGLFKQALRTVDGAVPVIAGTGDIATRDVIDLSLAARSAGVQGLMVLPPYYCLPKAREVVEHYRQISSAARLPILLYNIPKRTGVDLTLELLERLVEVEYVAAIKESGDSFVRVEELVRAFGDTIQVFTGHSAERGVPAVLMGAKGWVSSLESQILGSEAVQMYDAVSAGRIEEARRTQLKCLALENAVRRFGTFPSNVKAAMNLVGRPGGYARSPLLPLTTGEQDQLAGSLEELGLSLAAGSRT